MMSVSASKASDDNDFSQYAPGIMPMPDFEALARDIQNRASRRVGAATTETGHFREFFGTSVIVVKKTWELLERDSLLPEGGRSKHLLWALHFMKVYPSRARGVRPSARLSAPSTQRPTTSGSGRLSTPSPTWSTLWQVKSQCEDRCGSDVLLKCCGSIEASGAAVDGDDGARCGQRASISSNPCFCRLRICLFSQHLVLTPPPLPPPQTQIDFESRSGAHDVLNNCTMTKSHFFVPS